MKRFTQAAMAAAFLLLGGVVAMASNVPGKLSDVCNLSANPVPEERSSDLQGVYDGFWADVLPQTVIIASVNGDQAHVYYVHGTYGPWGINSPACYDRQAEVTADGRIVFPLGSNRAEFTLEDGMLKGTHISGGRRTPGEFTRVY